MDKVYKSTLTRGYCNYWPVSKGIIELISNAIDSDGDFQYDIDSEAGIVELHSVGVTVANTALLMGLSDKKGDDSKIGQFGLGLVQALVVLLANDCKIQILNGDKLWLPAFEVDNTYGTEVFVIKEFPLEENHNMFSIRISGLHEEDILEVRDRCIMLHEEEPEVLFEGDGVEVLADLQGRIYMGGILIQELPQLSYGYSLPPKYVPLSQDRDAVNSWDLVYKLSSLWKEHAPEGLLKAAITNKIEEVKWQHNYVREYGSTTVEDSLAEDFIEENKGALLASSPEEVKHIEAEGGKAVYLGNETLTKSILESETYANYSQEFEVEEYKELQPSEEVEIFIDKLHQHFKIHDHEEMDKLASELLEKSESWWK